MNARNRLTRFEATVLRTSETQRLTIKPSTANWMIENSQERTKLHDCADGSSESLVGLTSNSVFNFEQLLKQFNGNEEFAIYITEKFIAAWPEYRKGLAQSVANADWKQVYQVAHKLIGATSCLSICRVCEVAEQIETATENPQVDEVELLLSKIDDEIDSFLKTFKEERRSILRVPTQCG